MSEPIIKIFAFFGALTIIGLLILATIFICKSIKELIEHLKWKYEYKHRFDKPPTAKCYCNDCEYHAKDLQCNNVTWADRCTPDNGFCYEATPRKEANKC